ncbi:hypothetical protein DDZ13_07370 [Coraliomargarita sinensis]|uniref:Uncharacterized protein n=1 Tax=Coraliomargarita sinensis TaxID=2174842 RepID=A0A317ZFJ3_9BACT|nr:hypothetical protein [Coraliomargarita sinensis]PXA04344.1 hypothetical protein DDZ13_07370 [Coraliomargarita sinensis]
MDQKQNTAIITLAGKKAELCFDRHARYRYGQMGGNLNALLTIPGQDYFQTIILIWAALDEQGRKTYPSADMLVDELTEQDERYEAVLQAAVNAGWFGKQSKKENS